MTAVGRSFDETAPTYAAVRPAYPLDALAWLVPDGADRVLDLGAGTGKLTRQLVDAGYDVVAVEPSPQLGAELSAYVPAAELRMGTAEDIPLPDAEVEAVLVGSAFHWFDHDAALAEITRVLRPGGRLGLVRNRPDGRQPWVAELDGITGARSRRGKRPPTPTAAPTFDGIEQADFLLEYEVTPDSLTALIQTFSYYLVLDHVRRADLLRAVDELVRRHPDLAGRESFVLPYVTHCWRGTRS